MPDEPVGGAPGGGAAPVSSGTSAPASTPSSTPVATPATPAAPAAPVTPAAVAPTTPAAPPTKNPGESDSAFLERYHKFTDEQPKTGDELPEKKEEAKPVVATEPEKKPVVAEEKKPDAKQPEEKPADAPVVNDLDKLGPLPASEMTELLTANPELNEALEKAGIKDRIFDSLRGAAEAEQFKEEIGSIETARFAKQAAATFTAMDDAASNLKRGDINSTIDFVRDVLMPMDSVLDEDGKPRMMEVRGSDGQIHQVPQTMGVVDTLMTNIRDVGFAQVEFDAKRFLDSPDENMKKIGERAAAAMEEVNAFIDLVSGKQSTSDELPEHLKAEAERIRSEGETLTQAKVAEANRNFESFRNEVRDAVDGHLNKEVIGAWIDQSSLAIDPNDSGQVKASKQFVIDGLTTKIRDAIQQKLAQNQLFLGEQDDIGRRGYSAKTKAGLVNLYNRYAQRLMKEVATPILKAAGYERVRQSTATAKKIATQEKNSRMEPQGVTRPSLPGTQELDRRALMAKAREDFIKENRREPRPEETVERFRKMEAMLLSKPA